MFKPTLAPVILLLCVLLLTSCEGYRTAFGVVKDKATSELLDSVYCLAITSNDFVITDSTGYYKVYNLMGGCMPRCKDIIVRFTKTGYDTLVLKNPTDTVVFMEKR